MGKLSKGESATKKQKCLFPFKKEGRLRKNRKLWLNLWLFLFFIGLVGVFVIHFMSEEYSLQVDTVSPNTIKATRTITFEDEKQTEEMKQQAAEGVGEVYVLDTAALLEMEEEIGNVFLDFKSILRRSSNTDKLNILKSQYGLSDMTANVLLYMESDTIGALQSETLNLLRTNWRNGVRDVEVEEKTEKIFNQIELLNYNAPYRELIKAVFNEIELRGNYNYDKRATQMAMEEAVESVAPVMVTIRKGQKIIDEGEVVTEEQLEILRVLGLQREVSPLTAMAGIIIFLVLIIILTYLFVRQYRRELFEKGNNLILFSLLLFIVTLMIKLVSSVEISSQSDIAGLIGYLVPVATGSMLIAILLDTKLAIFMTIIFSFFLGIFCDNQLPYAINAFAGGVVGVYSVSRFSQRMDWAKAGLFIACANIGCILAFALINSSPWNITMYGLLLGTINGFFAAIMAYGSLPFLESGFKVTTSVRLLELSNPNQPLLKRLLLEAPGTYHHSVLVGNLGEAAADAVGADSLLVRVGAYYHDIGKLKRPYFFIENQLGEENPHNRLTPQLSTLIITSHIKDGLELAKEHGIPPIVADMIEQHHGTSLVTYFYHKAVEMGNADSIKEEEYRYNAQKPQTKEAAILMLADNVEAAVRSMPNVTTEKIEVLVRKIINEKLQDGQLNESELKFKDLEKIAETFTRILNGIFHTRIEYPEGVLEKMKEGVLPDENSDKQQAEADAGDKQDKSNQPEGDQTSG